MRGARCSRKAKPPAKPAVGDIKLPYTLGQAMGR